MTLKKLLKFKAKLLIALIFAASLLTYPVFGPRLIAQLFRHHAAVQVFKVYGFIDEKEHHSSFGTGSIIRVPGKQKTYLITNRHVCEDSLDGFVTVEQDSMSKRLKIVAMSETTDLCAVESIVGYSGLQLDTTYASADDVMVVGHPRGFPTTRTDGEIIGYENVVIIEKIKTPKQEQLCRRWKNTKVKLGPDKKDDDEEDDERDSGSFTFADAPVPEAEVVKKKVKYCFTIELRSTLSTTQVMPGSSGSPLLTWYGTVVGVVFATNSRDSWARSVPLDRLASFMKGLP